MRLGARTHCGTTGAVHHHVDAQLTPRRQLFHCVEVADRALANPETVLGGLNPFRPAPIIGVDREERRERRDVFDIRDRAWREKITLQSDTHQRPPNPAKAMNCYVCHTTSSRCSRRAPYV